MSARWAQDGARAAIRRRSWAEPWPRPERSGPARVPVRVSEAGDYLYRDVRSTKSTREDACPTVLPLLLELVRGPERLPVDQRVRHALRARLQLLQAAAHELEALLAELSAGLVSISSEDVALLVAFRSSEELRKFSTYQAAGLLALCLEELLLEPDLWLEEEEVAVEVRVQEETLERLHEGLLAQEGSWLARCSSSQMWGSCTSGGALYLEQGQVAQVQPPLLGSAWTLVRLADGARGTGPRAALEPLQPFHQWVLRSDGGGAWTGGGGAQEDVALQFAAGTCLAVAEHQASGAHELSLAPGDRVTILGRLASCFHWFTGRRESTGNVGLVRTGVVEASREVFSSTDVFLEGEEQTFFPLHEDSVVEEATLLLHRKSQQDFGHSYKLDTIPDADFEVSAPLAERTWSGWVVGERWSGVGGRRTVDQVASAPPAPLEDRPRFRVPPVTEGNYGAKSIATLLSFLEGASYRPEFAALYTLNSQALAYSLFTGHAGEDELIGFLGVARETASKQRRLWPQTRLCYLLGKLCAARLKLSQARLYLEETLSVPRDGFADLRLLASIFSSLVGVYRLQKNTKGLCANAERLAGLLFGSPDCLESLADNVVLKYVLKKAVLCSNRMAEARACHLLARFHRIRAEADQAVPYLERLLVLSAAAEIAPPSWTSRVSLALARLYSQLGLPRLSVSAARKATSLQSCAALADCLSAATLVLDLTKEEDGIPAQLAPCLHRALALTGAQADQHQVLRYHLTMCLCRLFCECGTLERAIHQMHCLLGAGSPRRHLPVSAAERDSALLWLAWLYLERHQPHAALDILDAVLDSMPEDRATLQAGTVLNMRGVALGCTRNVRGAAECYQAAADVCEQRGDAANWAVAQANRGLLCLRAGAPGLAQRQLTQAVKLLSRLDLHQHRGNLVVVLLRLGRSYVQQPQYLDYGRGCYEWALLLSISAGLLERQLTATRHLCQLYERQCPDQGRCVQYHQHQVWLLRALRVPAQEAESLEALSRRYVSLDTESAYRAALDSTKSSLALFIDLGWKEKEAAGWLQAGRIYYLLGQSELVDLYLQAAQDAALSTGDTGFLLEILEAAGDLFFNGSRDRHKAVPFYRDRALPISRRSSGARLRLRLCNKLTGLMLSLRSYHEAVEFVLTALEITVSQGNRLNERVACHRLAGLYQRLGQYELAEHYYVKALALCPAPLLFQEETLYYVQVYHTLGDLTFHHLKEPLDAAGYYLLALAAAVDLGSKRSQLQLCARLASIYHNFLSERELSLFFYQKARSLAAELNLKR